MLIFSLYLYIMSTPRSYYFFSLYLFGLTQLSPSMLKFSYITSLHDCLTNLCYESIFIIKRSSASFISCRSFKIYFLIHPITLYLLMKELFIGTERNCNYKAIKIAALSLCGVKLLLFFVLCFLYETIQYSYNFFSINVAVDIFSREYLFHSFFLSDIFSQERMLIAC